MIFGIADDGNFNAEAMSRSPLRHRFGCVVGAFGVNVRAEVFEQGFYVRFAEQEYVVDGAKRGHEEGAGALIKNGAAGAFQSRDAQVGIDADNQEVAFAAGSFEIADVTHVKSIKTTVGKDDSLAELPALRQFAAEQFARDDFGFRLAHGSGGSPAGLVANGSEKLIARDGGRAALHDHQTAGDVCDVRGFERRSARGQCERICRKNRVARSGDVDGLVAAVDRYLPLAASRFEERHAMAPARDKKGAQLHFRECSGATARQFRKILADGNMMQGFELCLIGRGRGNAGPRVGVKIVARIERDGWRVPSLRDGLADESRRGHAEAIIGDGQGMRGTKLGAELCLQFFVNALGQRRLRLAIDAENLLTHGVGPAGEDACFGGSGPTFDAQDTRNVDAFAAEISDERIAGGIIADGAEGKDPGAEGRKIVGGVGASAWNEMRFPMAKDQDGGFARDTRNLAKLKLISDKIAEENDGFRRELLDIVREG